MYTFSGASVTGSGITRATRKIWAAECWSITMEKSHTLQNTDPGRSKQQSHSKTGRRQLLLNGTWKVPQVGPLQRSVC